MKSEVTRFIPAKLAAWILAVTTLFAPFSLTTSAQAIDDNSNGQTQEADSLNLAHDASDYVDEDGIRRRGGDDFKSPRAAERFRRRQEALKQRLAGSQQTGRVHQVANGQYVELGLEKTDKIFVVLVEYGTGAGQALPATAGPLHNQIPQPNRSVDNNTIWQANYDRTHYEDMYFNRMAQYYRTQSSGRYTVNGQVTEWVRVPFNGYRYGTNSMGDAGAWTLIADAVNTWTKEQLASGKTLAEVTEYLQSFDNWDRYDFDADGNFDEPDGYIDHFQIVHSGAGEETGGGTLGAAAIWSHRWQAWYNFAGVTGPSFNKDGGVEFGGGWGANPNGGTFGSSGAAVQGINTSSANSATVQNAHPVNHTGIYVGDYTIQPENGGLGVFAHEFGHDLGLPDHYDRNGGSNATGFWTIMSSGSYLGDGTIDIGARPGDFGAWDKLQLGWLNYEVADPSRFSSVRLGPAETNTRQAQAVIVPLAQDKNIFYLFDPAVGSLAYGTKAWWGGKGDNVDNTLTRTITVPAAPATLQMRLNYQIETNWDYAYVSVSTNGGTTWTNLSGTYLNGAVQSALTTNSNPNGQNLGNGITGTSNGAWRLASFNLNAYAGQTVLVRLRYKTDPFVNQKGIMADEIKLGTFADGAETGDNGWTLNGFKITSGIENSNAPHFYIAEYRQYRTYDAGLQTGPYTFGRSGSGLPSLVDHYPYQDGLLVWYWDAGMADNDTSLHRGEGLVLPIDSHPEPLLRNVQYPGQAAFTSPWSSTVQSYDSPFGIEPTDGITLPYTGNFAGTLYQFFQSHPSLSGVSVFNDNNTYWYATTPTAGVIVPKTGATIRIFSTSAQESFMQVQIAPAN